MRLPFRQGIIRSDNQYLTVSGGNVSLTPNAPLELTIADRTVNYYHVENSTVTNAWTILPADYLVTTYLYIDLNVKTGERTFGYTTTPLTFSSAPPASPSVNHNWFNTTTNTMGYYNGHIFVKVNRVFVGTHNQGSVQYLNVGSQVGLSTNKPVFLTGAVLFDLSGKALTDSNNYFVTTESTLRVSASYNYALRLDAGVHKVTANDNMSLGTVVRYETGDRVGIANGIHRQQFLMLLLEDATIGELCATITSGEATNTAWNFSEAPGTKVYLDDNGVIVTPLTPSVSPSALTRPHIGWVIGSDRIFFNPN